MIFILFLIHKKQFSLQIQVNKTVIDNSSSSKENGLRDDDYFQTFFSLNKPQTENISRRTFSNVTSNQTEYINTERSSAAQGLLGFKYLPILNETHLQLLYHSALLCADLKKPLKMDQYQSTTWEIFPN